MGFIDVLAKSLDKLRIVPRIALGLFIYMIYDTLQWYMTLDEMGMYQAGVLGVLLTSAPFWFNLYLNGNKGDK